MKKMMRYIANNPSTPNLTVGKAYKIIREKHDGDGLKLFFYNDVGRECYRNANANYFSNAWAIEQHAEEEPMDYSVFTYPDGRKFTHLILRNCSPYNTIKAEKPYPVFKITDDQCKIIDEDDDPNDTLHIRFSEIDVKTQSGQIWELYDARYPEKSTKKPGSDSGPQPQLKKEITMKITNPTLINGRDAKDFDDSELIQCIRSAEENIASLGKINAESKRIKKLIKDEETNIKALVKILDTRK